MFRLAQWRLTAFVLAGSLLATGQVQDTKRDNNAANATLSSPDTVIFTDTHSDDLLPFGTDPENRVGLPFLKHLAGDQRRFWTRTSDISLGEARNFAPFAGFTGLLIAGDSWLAKQVPDRPNQLKLSRDISNYATFSLVGSVGGALLWGQLTNNDHLKETGLLSGEALLNSVLVTSAFKGITQRERPMQGNGSGRFFQGGSSFPSEHSAVAWSVASVVAHEYPGPLTKFLAYGLASAVTLTRVTGKEHFASDVLVGSALGWYFGRQVYRAHHDTELGGAPWDNFLERTAEASRSPENMGSPYVPIDSWVYPVFDRLAALGYVQTAYLGMRPWTRMECARLLEEAGERLRYGSDSGGDAGKLYDTLWSEFLPETGRLNGDTNIGFSVDSIYMRATTISGPPLRDSFHFGQTIINDYGRPFGEGFNSIAGVTAHAVAGPLSFEVQGEYQHAPANPSYAPDVLDVIAQQDQTRALANGTNTANRFRLLNASVGVTVKNLKISFGKESAWLGPSAAGPFLFSDNAAPITMLRFDSVSPFHVPLLSRLLGPARSEFFVGQLSGHQWVFANTFLDGPNIDPQPFVHGNKISFKPTANLEFGMGVTTIFGGPGLPFTWSNFLRSYYSHKASIAENPGKRFSAFDFSYRVPGLRNWLTVYLDSMVVDEISPLGSTRPSITPGVYLPRVPRIPKLELRFEGMNTSYSTPQAGPGYVYADRRYRDGYTNDGNLIGNWIGRAGTGGQAWATYSFSPRNRLQLAFRHAEVDHNFLQGGHVNDFAVHSDVMLGPDLALSGSVQYERWAFPLLASQPQSNVTASFQLTFSPRRNNR